MVQLTKIPFRQKSMLLKIFLSVFLISASVLVIVTLSLFLWFRNEMIVSFENLNKTTLYNIDAVFSKDVSDARDLAIELYENPNVKSCLLKDTFLVENNLALLSQLNYILAANSHINSIYLFKNEHLFFNVVSKKYASDEAKNELFEKISTTSLVSGPFYWTMKNRLNDDDIKTMTAFYHEATIDKPFFMGAVGINIDLDVLKKSIFSKKLNDNQNFFIIDNKGTVLLHNNMEIFGEDLSNEPYIQKILNSNENYITFNIDYKGKNTVFSAVQSSKSNYYIVSQMEYSYTVADLNKTTNIWLAVCFALFVIILVISFVASYKLYLPFNNVISNLSSMPIDVADRNRLTEIQFLNKFFNKMTEKLDSLSKQNESNTLVKMLMQEDSANTVQELLKSSNVLTECCSNFLVITSIDGNTDSDIRNKEALTFESNTVITIVSDYLERIGKCTSYEIDTDKSLFIVTYEGHVNPNNVTNSLNEAQNLVTKISNLSITIGVSDLEASDQLSIKEMFVQASSCIQMKIFMGSGIIINYSDLAEICHDDIPIYYSNDVVNAVKSSNLDTYNSAVDKLFTICKKYSFKKSMNFLSGLTLSIIDTYYGVIDDEKIPVPSNYLEIYDTLSSLDNPSALKAWFSNLFVDIICVIEEMNGRKLTSILPDIINYINHHYDDTSLSANLLAEQLNISPQYFSKLFNDNYGCSIPDYVNTVRLEKAKELLVSEQDLDINSICTMVGFNSSSYFTTSFKKKYGITPSKFRLSMLFRKK